MVSVRVENLAKSYPVYRSGSHRLSEILLLQTVSFHKDFWALENVSFTIDKGESFGIIGVNGSGKSTLLQILAGILRPTSGLVETEGRISALLELGSGFNQEFTGRENVYMNASILGMSRKEIDDRLPDIEDFAEIGVFIDQPVRTYSSGMMMRLAFSVAINADPEILIVDEAIAVGDVYFRQRCLRRIHQMRSQGATILFVSHSPTDIKAFCDRCLWLDKGRIADIGSTDKVLARYLATTVNQNVSSLAAADQIANDAPSKDNSPALMFGFESGGHRFGTQAAEILGASVLDEFGEDVRAAYPGMHVTLRITAAARQYIGSPIVGFLLRNKKGEVIFGTNTSRDEIAVAPLMAGELFSCDFSWAVPELFPSRYGISVAIGSGTMDSFEIGDLVDDAVFLTIHGNPDDVHGYLRIPCHTVTVVESFPSGDLGIRT